jgi:hypothetical protein
MFYIAGSKPGQCQSTELPECGWIRTSIVKLRLWLGAWPECHLANPVL